VGNRAKGIHHGKLRLVIFTSLWAVETAPRSGVRVIFRAKSAAAPLGVLGLFLFAYCPKGMRIIHV